MRSRGYDDTYVQRYKMVTSFFQQRRPLIILICGVPCTGALTGCVAQGSGTCMALLPCAKRQVFIGLMRLCRMHL